MHPLARSAAAGERAVALPAGCAGGAQRLGRPHRQSTLAHTRAHAGVAPAALPLPDGRRRWRQQCPNAATISRMNTTVDEYGVFGHPVGHTLSPFIHGLFART